MARLGALFALLSVTFLPLISCGPVKFRGYELLLDHPPARTHLEREVDAGSTPLIATEDVSTPRREVSEQGHPKAEGKLETFYPPGYEWLRALLAGVMAIALLGVLLGKPAKLMITLGVLGAFAQMAFVDHFMSALVNQMTTQGDMSPDVLPISTLGQGIGSFLGLLGFGAMILGGSIDSRKGTVQGEAPAP